MEVTMKCITKNDTVKRVTEEQAATAVNKEGWNYCPKSKWKAQARNKGADDVQAEG